MVEKNQIYMNKFFNDCMKCEHAIRKRMIGSKEWSIACEMNHHGLTWGTGADSRHFYKENEAIQLIQDCCPYFVEKIMEQWNEQ